MQLTSSVQPQGPSHSPARDALRLFACVFRRCHDLLSPFLRECLAPVGWVPGQAAGCWDAGPDAVTHHTPQLHRHGGLVSAAGHMTAGRLGTSRAQPGSWGLLGQGWVGSNCSWQLRLCRRSRGAGCMGMFARAPGGLGCRWPQLGTGSCMQHRVAGSQQAGLAMNLSHLVWKRGSAGPGACTSKHSTDVRQRQGLLS